MRDLNFRISANQQKNLKLHLAFRSEIMKELMVINPNTVSMRMQPEA